MRTGTAVTAPLDVLLQIEGGCLPPERVHFCRSQHLRGRPAQSLLLCLAYLPLTKGVGRLRQESDFYNIVVVRVDIRTRNRKLPVGDAGTVVAEKA